MRILRLTSRVEEKILAARHRRDVRGEAVASRIVGDVRRRGDAALFAWIRRLDGIRLTPKNLWVSVDERRAAARTIPKDLRAALEHAARNIRRIVVRRLRAGIVHSLPAGRKNSSFEARQLIAKPFARLAADKLNQ